MGAMLVAALTGATGFRCRLAYQCKLTACSPFCVYPRNNNRLQCTLIGLQKPWYSASPEFSGI